MRWGDVLKNSATNGLSPRENEVLQLIAEGYSNKQIADILCISIKTVQRSKTMANQGEGLKMVTTADLIKDAENQKQQEALRKARLQKAYEETKAARLLQHKAEADCLLSGKLGDALIALNRKGIKNVRMDMYRVYVMDEFQRWEDAFMTSPLTFEPNPDYEPTQILLSRLRAAGFIANISSHEEAIHEVFVTASDGYDFGNQIGTRTVFSLIIEWS